MTNPEPEFELFAEKCLESLKPIYSLASSGDEWHQTRDDHVKIDPKMTATIIDSSQYCQFVDGQPVGINGSYVNDILRTGTDE